MINNHYERVFESRYMEKSNRHPPPQTHVYVSYEVQNCTNSVLSVEMYCFSWSSTVWSNRLLKENAWNQLSARIASLVQQHTLSFWISLSLSDWMSAELLLACDTKNWKAYEILFMLNLTVFTSQYHPATLIYPVASV